jgi:hypothetical protein
MRFFSVDGDAARNPKGNEATTARKVHESVAVHAALGPIAIEIRLKDLDREIDGHKARGKPYSALSVAAFGEDSTTPRRRFLFSLAGAGLLTRMLAPRGTDTVHPSRSCQLQEIQQIQQEREALSLLKQELS